MGLVVNSFNNKCISICISILFDYLYIIATKKNTNDMKTRNENKHTVKTFNHTIEYPFGADKIINTIIVALTIIKTSCETYTISSTGAKGYVKQVRYSIVDADNNHVATANKEDLENPDDSINHSIITATTGTYYNDTLNTYFKSNKNLF